MPKKKENTHYSTPPTIPIGKGKGAARKKEKPWKRDIKLR